MRNCLFTIGLLAVAALLSACRTVSLPPPPVAGDWKPIPALCDEFDGSSLDHRKWRDAPTKKWPGRPPGLFRASNVTVVDGMLNITARVEDVPNPPKGFHTFTSALVKSWVEVRYGYFEIRSRAMKSKASSAFWFYKSSDKREHTEIDVFEICGVGEKERTLHTNFHVFRSPTIKTHWHKPYKWQAPFVLADEYHVYGLLWTPEIIRWYVDGKPIRTEKNVHWHQALNMCFDSEIFVDWFGTPDKADLPSVFSIDYIRSWTPADGSGTVTLDPADRS